ncbi:MAG: hypothetical protein GY851_14155, partial [bacterium]|nr:hypothetical protein [bacterium]
IARLPKQAALQSVSEWSLPITRGSVESTVGEYSLSAIGPGPRATRHWALARARGMDTIAKTQMSTTWELGSVPYVPVVENVARHVANLRDAGVTGLMLSWTLGSYPSPGFEVAMELCDAESVDIDAAMRTVAARRFGEGRADAVVRAWRAFSEAFKEYPFGMNVVYQSVVHMGPANLLWGEPTGYDSRHIMGFGHPLDGLDAWRGVYPPEVFRAQFTRVASGFWQGMQELVGAITPLDTPDKDEALLRELLLAETCAIHFESVARQTEFLMLRDGVLRVPDKELALDMIEVLIQTERDSAIRLHGLQSRDSRIGFEAACHYFYIGTDLAEKVINCDDLLERWLPAQRARFAKQE